jgi:hypothetical protein
MMIVSSFASNDKTYTVVPHTFSSQPFIASFGFRTGQVNETTQSIRNVVDFINENIIQPTGNCLAPQDAVNIINETSMKFPYFDVVGKQGLINILLLDNTHVFFNSLCGVNAAVDASTLFLFNMKDEETSPEYVFLHELGHALQISLTGSVTLVPNAFINFHDQLSTGLKQNTPDAAEVFADSFAIAVMHGTYLQDHNPFSFDDKLIELIDYFFIGLFGNK